jgi:CRISPR/Cas system-associated exonuclease Cas4 (RecB family)
MGFLDILAALGGNLIRDLAQLNTEVIALAVIVVSAVIIFTAVSSFTRQRRQEAGADEGARTLSIDGSTTLKVRHYISDMQGLAGRPDGLISENGYIIPVERKPLARKLRDRYVAQLLVYMRLIEEFEGKRPPYGYLILGPSCRKFKIDNSPERQAWLQNAIDQMRGIIEGAPARATPLPRKCRKCDVRQACKFRATDS